MAIKDLPKEMLAAQVVEYKKPYKIHKIPTPTSVSGHDILVKIAVASNCHTDGMVQNGVFGTKLPCTASHEGAGTIVAVGDQVKSMKEGDRVMCGLPYKPCGKCSDCTGPESYTQYCTQIEGYTGVHRDGNFAEYAVVDERTSTLLPNEVTFESAAPLACAGRTVWRGVLQAELKEGQWIALVGSGGGLGHLGIQFAKALGLKVIGIDARDDGLALTKSTGADIVVDARKGKDEMVKQVQEATNGEGADATLNLSDAPSAAATACAVTKMHGLMIQIAQPDEVSIPFPEFIFRDVRVHGSLICSPDESRRMLDVVAKHRIKVKTNPFDGLEKLPELVELAHGGKIQGKAIIIVDKEQIKKERENGAKY